MENLLTGMQILITGGTGSLGTALTRRILSGQVGHPHSIAIFSRDELKQSEMKAVFSDKRLKFIIGDVRDKSAIEMALNNVDVVFNTAAMKRVEVCQRWPMEAIKTNLIGTWNIIETIACKNLPIKAVVGVSSDKSAEPVNSYGASKFLQEQLILTANEDCPNTRFVSVVYGNVMCSRGSVIPVWIDQISKGGPLTIRDPNMTRFLISLPQAVDTLLAALKYANPGEVYVPKIPAARIIDIANVLIGGNSIEVTITGKQPGEKMDEVMVTEEESFRTTFKNGYYVVTNEFQNTPALKGKYVSRDHLINISELESLFIQQGIIKPVGVLA